MARTIENVPVKHCLPMPGFVLVQQFDANETEAGLHLPATANAVIHIAKKVGEDVELVQEGDIVIIAATGVMAGLPQLKEMCALIHKDHISGVIRGYDWRAARKGVMS